MTPPSTNVDPLACASWISVSISYDGPSDADADANGIVDACEVVGDLDRDGVVGAKDLAILLGTWGPCAACAADFNGDGAVDAADLSILLGAWS